MATREIRQIKGLQQLGENMRALSNVVSNKLARTATGKAAGIVKRLAVQHVVTNPSVDTGSLRDAIVAKKASNQERGNLTSMHLVAVRQRSSGRKTKRKQSSAPHASLVEFGTRKMAAEPYMRPAFDQGKEQALKTMVDTLSSGIDKATAAMRK